MAKISQMFRLRSIYKTMKGLKKDIKTTHESMKGMKKSKTLIRLDKHINKAMKGFRSISQSTTGRTHKRSKKYKKSMKISSQDVDDNTCKKGLSPFESGDILHDSHGIAQDRSLNLKGFGFPGSSRSATGCMHRRGEDFFPSYKTSVKISSPDDKSLLVNEDDIRFCNFGILPTKRRSGLPPSDTPDIPMEKIVRAYGLTCKVPGGFYMLIKDAVLARKCLDRNENDSDFTTKNKNRLINLENDIHRCAGFYIDAKILPHDWKYDPTVASTLSFEV